MGKLLCKLLGGHRWTWENRDYIGGSLIWNYGSCKRCGKAIARIRIRGGA